MIKEADPLWSRLIKPLRDLEIQQVIENIPVNLLTPYDKEFTFAERFDPINKLHLNFIRWINPSVIGLIRFQKKYITNGNTNFIDQVVLTQRPARIIHLKGDYSYYSYLANALKIQRVEITIDQLDTVRPSDLFLISVPFANNGKNENGQVVIDYCHTNQIPLAVDIAYSGLTPEYSINLTPRENLYVGFTFSKTFGIPYNRIGVCYAGSEVAGLNTMNSIGYVNLSGVNIVNTIMRKFPKNFMYNKYNEEYKRICSQLSYTPTDCILFAYNGQDRVCITEYYSNTSISG
jgi:hypothetical protein